MLALISPAKKLDFDSECNTEGSTQPTLLPHTQELSQTLKALSQTQIQSLMKLSDNLGALNYSRYQRYINQ